MRMSLMPGMLGAAVWGHAWIGGAVVAAPVAPTVEAHISAALIQVAAVPRQPRSADLPSAKRHTAVTNPGYHPAAKSTPDDGLAMTRKLQGARFHDEPAESPSSFDSAGRGSCGPECDFCWIETPWENNCDWVWEDDGYCDCGCQFPDTVDCFSVDLPDLIVENSSVGPTVDVMAGVPVALSDTVANIGVGPANPHFRLMWYISEDDSVTSADLPWGFRDVQCCLAPGATSSMSGSLPWPDIAPYDTPGQTYYVAIVADDGAWIAESDEANNWGEVRPVTLVTGAHLLAAAPNHGESLWRSENNLVRLVFDGHIAAPAPGDVQIRELLQGGGFGPDLSAFFAFDVEVDGEGRPRLLSIQEQGNRMTHRRWYGFSSSGWGGAFGFDVHYVVQVGDVNNDGQVLGYDVSAFNSGAPKSAAEHNDRRDVNGDGRILSDDVDTVKSVIPSFAAPKPNGH